MELVILPWKHAKRDEANNIIKEKRIIPQYDGTKIIESFEMATIHKDDFHLLILHQVLLVFLLLNVNQHVFRNMDHMDQYLPFPKNYLFDYH